MLLIVPIKSQFRRAVFHWCSMRLFCDHDPCISKLRELGCSKENADFLVRKNKKILTVDTCHINRVVKFCRNNLKLKDILEYPTIISLPPEVLDDRMSTLKELGCAAVTARNLLLFNQFMQMTPSRLRWKGYMIVPETSFPQTVRHLNCPNDLKVQLTSKLLDLHSNNVELKKIKASVNVLFLAWKLQCSEEVATDMIKKERSLSTKSLGSLEKVCKMLLKNFELPISKVHSCSQLLTINCNAVEDLVLKVPKICGVSIHDIVKKQPLILKRSVKSVYNTVSVLERHGVTDVQLLSCTKILKCNASTVSSRLERLACVEKCDDLKTSKKFLWIVLYFNDISKIKKIVEDVKIQFSLSVLLATFEPNAVIKHFKEQSPMSNSIGDKRDLFSYLSVTFGERVKTVKKELQHNPNINFSSVRNAQKVVKYLTSKGISKKQIRNGLDIVLYDVNVVVQHFSDLPNREDLYIQFSEWIEHPNLIQLLLYVIEKDNSCIGNGVRVRTAEHETQCDKEEEILLVEDIALNSEL